jgi:hypothetical protein
MPKWRSRIDRQRASPADDGHRATLGQAKDCRGLEASGIHDRPEVLHPLLDREQSPTHAIR